MTVRVAIRLHTDDPIIITASSASSDQGESLRYIPGAALWGVLASKLYGAFDNKGAWNFFHSGALRVSNAYPACKGTVAWPVPLSLHHKKGEEALLSHAICAASNELEEFAQYKQFRDGFVNTGANALLNPDMQDAIKTAINPDTGTAAESRLFASESISAGQDFVFWLEGPSKLVAQAQAVFDEDCYVGRSRSAEFGKVSLTPVAMEDWPTVQQVSGTIVYVWLLSDLCLTDQYGQPTLHPNNLAPWIEGEIDWTRSFLRFRNAWPYNAKWEMRGLERQMIAQGSVFTLKNATANTGFTWIGEENASGFGLSLVSSTPPLKAMHEMPVFRIDGEVAETTAQKSRLTQWLQDCAGQKISRDEAFDAAETKAADLLSMLSEARAHAANRDFGLTKTQLNQLRNGVAESLNGSDTWKKKLWRHKDSRTEDPAWSFLVPCAKNKTMVPISQWFEEELERCGQDQAKLQALIKALELASKGLNDPEEGK